jgi:hypothetical protein
MAKKNKQESDGTLGSHHQGRAGDMRCAEPVRRKQVVKDFAKV